MALEFANKVVIESHIKDRVNANKSWGADVVGKLRFADAITNARRQASYEVLKSISRFPKSGAFGALATWVEVTNGEFFQYDGEVGIPRITPYADADPRRGLPADPDEIESWRTSPELFTGALDGESHPHDEVKDGRQSPLSCRYALVNSVPVFTGSKCEFPVMIITEAMADDKIPLGMMSTVIKLATPKLVKLGDALYQVARADAVDGRDDLIAIEQGAMVTKPPRPLPDIVTAQKQLI